MPLQAVYSRTAGQGMETKQGKVEIWQSPERQSRSYSSSCSRWELETQLLSFHMSVSVSNFNLLLFKLPKRVLSKIEYMFLSSGAALLSSSQNRGIICKSQVTLLDSSTCHSPSSFHKAVAFPEDFGTLSTSLLPTVCLPEFVSTKNHYA